MNISSAIVHAKPGTAAAVRVALETLPGVEVHAVSDEGKIIVTLESDDDRDTTTTFGTIGQIAGVLSVAMVYHQVEADPESYISAEA